MSDRSPGDKPEQATQPVASPQPNAPATPAPRPVDPRLLELLVCPLTKTRLVYRADTKELVSRAARLAFPIRDGVPLMIVEAARELDGDETV